MASPWRAGGRLGSDLQEVLSWHFLQMECDCLGQ